MSSIVEKGCWCGVLEAGSKSSPVVRDSALLTGKEDTIYLFNLNRKAFLEYRRDIVEGKLRELNGDEDGLAEQLLEAFEEARKGFSPRRTARPATRSKPKRKAADDDDEEGDEEIPDFPGDGDEDLDFGDAGDDDESSSDEDDEDDD